MDDTSKKKEKKYEFETSLSTAAVIKLGTRPSPPPRPMTYTTREPTTTHTTHTTRNTRVKHNTLFFTQKDTQPSQTCSGGHTTPNQNQDRFEGYLFAYGEYKPDYPGLY